MSVTDPIADMLTSIRNATMAKKRWVMVPSSSMKKAIVELLLREKYIRSYEEIPSPPQDQLRVFLKYDREGQSVISSLRKISTPGRRTYVKRDEIPRVRGGLGTAVLSTSGGVLTDKEARTKGLGGEWVCSIW